MIVVRVELHSAITGKVSELARMIIGNDGTGTGTSGNYDIYTLLGRNKAALDRSQDARPLSPNRQGKVLRHARLKLHVWSLVAKALRAVGYGEEQGKTIRTEKEHKQSAKGRGRRTGTRDSADEPGLPGT